MVTGLGESMGVEDLQLDALGHGIKRVGDAEEDAGVAGRFELEFEIEDEVAILALGEDVGVETLPAGLARARLQGDGAVGIVDPVTLGLPTGEVLTVEERYEARSVRRGVRYGRGGGAHGIGLGRREQGEGQEAGQQG